MILKILINRLLLLFLLLFINLSVFSYKNIKKNIFLSPQSLLSKQFCNKLSVVSSKNNTDISKIIEEIEISILETPRILNQIERSSENLNDFAIKNLNPFSTEKELLDFSNKIFKGKGAAIRFKFSPGFGEEIQANFIKKFIKKFFPQLLILENNESTELDKGDIIKLNMLDFQEMKNAHINAGLVMKREQDTQHKDSTIEFSMVQTKILHKVNVPLTLRKKLKEKIFSEIKNQSRYNYPDDLPLIIGSVNPLFFKDLNESFRFISTSGEVAVYDHIKKELVTEAQIDLGEKRILRFLYSIGDFASIIHDRNKMEAISNKIPVISTDIKYLDIHKNSNALLDQSFHKRGWIKTKSEIVDSGGLKKFSPQISITDNDMENIYNEYLDHTDRLNYEPSLKDSIKQVINKLESIYNKNHVFENLTQDFKESLNVQTSL